MRILWLDINSSYSHSSVALPAIHAQVNDKSDWEWSVVRGTINDSPGNLAAAVAQENPDIIAATFWLFTHRMQIEVLSRAVQLLDKVNVLCGGPEFLGDNESFLRTHPFVTAVLRGEGEVSLPLLLSNIENSAQWPSIDGLCWISDGVYHDNGIARVADFASLKYPEDSSFFCWDKPFVQLETTRGCFNTCAFCVSGGEKPLRYQSMSQVSQRLSNIYSHGIKDVRVLDRTFNYDVARSCEILDLFAGYHDKMRFHLEIHPSLINNKLREKIASLPAGLLHLEAGMQSLDAGVLAESGRKGSLEASLSGLEYLCSLDNVQTHADLIAGLPSYTLQMLYNDIIRLVKMGVDELQVESLKVLPGTKMRLKSDEHGLRYSPLPPYEVLQTSHMSPADLKSALQLSRTIDLYYNCGSWQNVVGNLIRNSHDFLREFTDYLNDIMVLDSPVSLERRGVILYDFCRHSYPEFVGEISVAWIEAGFSLKKQPAGNIVKIKNLETFLSANKMDISVEYGSVETTHRYYLFTSDEAKIIFGYDSSDHHPSPVFKAVTDN